MDQSKSCIACTASSVLESGRSEGALWCWVRGYAMAPHDQCSSFSLADEVARRQKRDAFDGRQVGRRIIEIRQQFEQSGVQR